MHIPVSLQKGQKVSFTRGNPGLKNNEATGEELLRYDLGQDFSIETATVFGELYKNGDEWKFNTIGSGYQGGLVALCNNYGVDIE